MSKWILFICELFIIFLVLWLSKWDGKPKQQRLFSITLPKEAFNHPELLTIQKWYQLRLSISFLTLLAATLLGMFIRFKYMSLELLFFIIIITLTIGIPSFLYGKANLMVRQVKADQTWEAGNFSHGIHEDDFWRYGQFYTNPFDSARTTSKRMGMGTTLNLAHKNQRRFLAITLIAATLLVVATLFSTFYMEVKTPSYRIDETTLNIDYPFYYYHAPLSDIKSLRILQKLPPYSKQNGIETSTFARGFYTVGGYGKTFLCVYKSGPYLLIETAEVTLIVNEPTEEKTYSLLEALDMVIPK